MSLPYDLQVPTFNLYYQLAEINIDIKDVAYNVGHLATKLKTVYYSHIAIYYGYIRSRQAKGHLLVIKNQTNRI